MSEPESNPVKKPKLSFSIRTMLLMVTVAGLVFLGIRKWKEQKNRKILDQWIGQIHNEEYTEAEKENPLECPVDLEIETQLSLLLYGAMYMDDETEQMSCLKLLVEQFPDDAKESLTRIALKSRNENTKTAAIRLLGLYRDEKILPSPFLNVSKFCVQFEDHVDHLSGFAFEGVIANGLINRVSEICCGCRIRAEPAEPVIV